jgi:hypothetical protein
VSLWKTVRERVILGAVVTLGLVAGVVLVACSRRPPPARPDAKVAPATVVDAGPTTRPVEDEQPLPRNYVE